MRLVHLPIMFLLTCLAVTPVMAETPDRKAEAVEVLKKFSGSWNTRARIRHEGPPAREFRTKGRAMCRPTLEGRYFEFRTQTVPPGQADLQVMTYDVEADVYRQWVFGSDGYRHEAEGRWNPARSTLRWEGKTAETSFVIEDRWVSPDRLEWTLLRTDAKGQKVQAIEGTLIRVKKQ